MELGRRGLLGGLLAAPAVIAVERLMPLSFVQPWVNAPPHVLTLQEIADEAARCLESLVGGTRPSSRYSQLTYGQPLRQLGVDAVLDISVRTLNMHDFRKRILAPVVGNLAMGVKPNDKFGELESPFAAAQLFSAVGRGHSLPVRVIQGYDLERDQTVYRFDILLEGQT